MARYRCTSCGNLTRFDVVTTRTERAFHHYSVGGELVVEEPEVVFEQIESVTCRWCGVSGHVIEVSEQEVGEQEAELGAADAHGPVEAS